MPDYTVKADVDTMLRANDKAAIRSAIGVGTTDAPTFLAQTLTGQSLTGTQATSLVDLSATWNTTGTPSALKLNVTNTASGAGSSLIDLRTDGSPRFAVVVGGVQYGDTRLVLHRNGSSTSSPYIQGGDGILTFGRLDTGFFASVSRYDIPRVTVLNSGCIGFGSNSVTITTGLFEDAAGILAQRNGTSAQAFRVYNTYDTAGTNYERFGASWVSNVCYVGTEKAGTGQFRSLALRSGGDLFFEVGGANRWQVTTAGHLLALNDNAYDIGASGANRPRNVYAAANATIGDLATANGVLTLQATSLPQLNINCTTASNSFNGLTINIGGSVRAGFLANMSSGEVKIGALGGSGYFSTFYSNGAEVMRFTIAGLVGIGTTTPSSKLTVTGGDIEVATIASGLILKSPDGTRYRVTVPNGGTVLTITAV